MAGKGSLHIERQMRFEVDLIQAASRRGRSMHEIVQFNIDSSKPQTAKQLRRRFVMASGEPPVGKQLCRGVCRSRNGRFIQDDGVVALDTHGANPAAFFIETMFHYRCRRLNPFRLDGAGRTDFRFTDPCTLSRNDVECNHVFSIADVRFACHRRPMAAREHKLISRARPTFPKSIGITHEERMAKISIRNLCGGITAEHHRSNSLKLAGNLRT